MAKILDFNETIEFDTSICEECPKTCNEESCLALELLRRICKEKHSGVQLKYIRNIALLFEE